MRVVLPAPLGPRRPMTRPGRHLEVDAVEHHPVPEPLADAARLEEVGHGRSLPNRGRCSHSGPPRALEG